MKKTLFVIFALAMILGLTACGKNVETTDANKEVPEVLTFAAKNGCEECEYDEVMHFDLVDIDDEEYAASAYLSEFTSKKVDGGYQYDFYFMIDTGTSSYYFTFVDKFTGEEVFDNENVMTCVEPFYCASYADNIIGLKSSFIVSDEYAGNVDFIFICFDDSDLENEAVNYDYTIHFKYAMENEKNVTFMHLPAEEVEYSAE